jgi:hypothetical protein
VRSEPRIGFEDRPDDRGVLLVMMMRFEMPVILSVAETTRSEFGVERDLDSRHTPGRRGKTGEFRFTEEVVLVREATLSLADLNENGRLIVRMRGEGLANLDRDSGVALDERSHDTAGGYDTKEERSYIEEDQLVGLLRGVAGQDGSLHGGEGAAEEICAERFKTGARHGGVGVDALEERVDLDPRSSGG